MLESISGIAFPRAENMCTRCPAVVSMERDDSVKEPLVVLATDASYEKECLECTLPEVGHHIQKLTDSLSSGGTITQEPIFIRVTMANCPTLTLMDLPGITSISPNQDDIEEATVALTNLYMANMAPIMLVVIPGFEDFNNPKALKLAFNHDSEGARTIGVVTKVDCLPTNSDIIEKIRMEREGDVRVEQGFIAVRNRSKDEMDLSADAVRERERNLFKIDPKTQSAVALAVGHRHPHAKYCGPPDLCRGTVFARHQDDVTEEDSGAQAGIAQAREDFCDCGGEAGQVHDDRLSVVTGP